MSDQTFAYGGKTVANLRLVDVDPSVTGSPDADVRGWFIMGPCGGAVAGPFVKPRSAKSRIDKDRLAAGGFCLDCQRRLEDVDKYENGDMATCCAKCRAEYKHDFDAEPDVKFARDGSEIEPPPLAPVCPESWAGAARTIMGARDEKEAEMILRDFCTQRFGRRVGVDFVARGRGESGRLPQF